MDICDGEQPGVILTTGRVYNPSALSWHSCPPRGNTLRLAEAVSEAVFHRYGFDAVRHGTAVRRVAPIAACTSGKILIRKRSDRAHYVLQDLVPLDGIDVHGYVDWTEDTSFILWLSWEWLEDKTTDRIPNLEDAFMPREHGPSDADMPQAHPSDVDIDRDNPSDSGFDPPSGISVDDASFGNRSASSATSRSRSSQRRNTKVPPKVPPKEAAPNAALKGGLKARGDAASSSSTATPSAPQNMQPLLPLAESDDDYQSVPSTDENAELYMQHGSALLDSANRFSGFVQPETSDELGVLRVSGPFKHATAIHADISDGKCYRVDVETDNLSASDLVAHEAAIMAADKSELASFLKQGVFELLERQHARSRTISCTWVRKWKRLQDGTRKIKSRLCARGFLDPQLGTLTKHSSTATRLSQKLLLSKAALEGWPVESWDVGSAFL